MTSQNSTRSVIMSSAYTEFYSHTDKDLVEHLLEVGRKTEDLYGRSKFKNPCMAYYAGLLHDIGKTNPWYQSIFHNEKSETDASKEYVRKHSVFSAWAIFHLLRKKDEALVNKILMLVYGHHTRLKLGLGSISKEDLFDKTHQETFEQITQFSSKVSTRKEFGDLDWDRCRERFCRNIQFDIELRSEESPRDFLDMSYAFSCLLQADRGSFSSWNDTRFNLSLDTENQRKGKSNLAEERTKFQEHVLKEFDDKFSILTINAPTGIGKTKTFLDLIQKCTQDSSVERVFYFSPLLALTEDFEKKIRTVTTSRKDILIYNHLHSETLAEKADEGLTGRYIFENESFNKQFIITTTHRLLMTIYSNRTSDKIKLASMRDSLLIIDEVQTIPKSILSNLKSMFKAMNKYMGTRFLLISATIPHELRDVDCIHLPEEMKNNYLKKTKKQISFRQRFDPKEITDGKVLVMANTRKKAVCRFFEILETRPERIMYMSSGIRKKDRINILNRLETESNFILVATQVVEAGVDISFSRIFREEAPLDNIIQVMGRLNREGEDENACLIIYKTDGKPVPYSPLEYKTTQKRIMGITDSTQIYDILEQYYKEVSDKNRQNKENTEKLGRHIKNMKFDEAWEMVKENLSDYDKDSVIIPDNEGWDDTKSKLNALSTNTEESYKNKISKNFGEMTASLPICLDKVGREKFDEELMEKNILLPKKEYLNEIYDKKIGLDKFLVADF